jgi:chromosome segregation ATPase
LAQLAAQVDALKTWIEDEEAAIKAKQAEIDAMTDPDKKAAAQKELDARKQFLEEEKTRLTALEKQLAEVQAQVNAGNSTNATGTSGPSAASFAITPEVGFMPFLACSMALMSLW